MPQIDIYKQFSTYKLDFISTLATTEKNNRKSWKSQTFGIPDVLN